MWKSIKFNFSLLNLRRYQTTNSLVNIYWMHNADRHCNRHQKVGEKQENNQGFYNSESQWEKCISLGSMTSNLNNE